MYKTFDANSDHEKKGVWFDYGSFRIRLARAGGRNQRFAETVMALMKPYRRAIQTDTLPEEKGRELMVEAYAQAIILAWEVKGEDGNWKSGIEARDGSVRDFSKANVIQALVDLPDLFAEIKEQSEKLSNYRDAEREADAGN
jgi:hypothetical protein